MTSIDLRITSKTSQRPQAIQLNLKKNKLKGGADNEITDINFHDFLYKKNLYMDLSMQIVSSDQTVKSKTVQDFKDFISQPKLKKENN